MNRLQSREFRLRLDGGDLMCCCILTCCLLYPSIFTCTSVKSVYGDTALSWRHCSVTSAGVWQFIVEVKWEDWCSFHVFLVKWQWQMYTNTRHSCWGAEISLWLSGDLIWGGVVFVFPTVLAAGLTSDGGDRDPSHLRNRSLVNKRLQPSLHAQLRNMQTEKAGCLIHPLNVIETETAH